MAKIYKKKSAKSRCCVPQCSSGCTVSLHSFPADPKLRKIWADILKINKSISKFMYVCSKHFSQRPPFRKANDPHNLPNQLKVGAVYSLNLPKTDKPAKLRINKIIRTSHQSRKVIQKTVIKESQEIEEPKTVFSFSEENNEVHTLIKKEHNYACLEGTGPQSKNEFLKDPLEIDWENIKIKTEVDEIEIKTEPVDTSYLSSVDVGNVTPIEYLEPNDFITANINLQESEVVPTSTFLELQERYKMLFDLLNTRYDRKILFENMILKMQITKLKESTEQNNIVLTNKISDLTNNVKKEAEEAAKSRNRASTLAIENEQLKHRLSQDTEYKDLEDTVTDLKQSYQNLLDIHNTAASDLQILRAELALTEKQNIDLIKTLQHLQANNAKAMKHSNYMKQKIEKSIKVKESLEKNMTLFAEKMNKTVADKNEKIDIEKKRTARLQVLLLEVHKIIETESLEKHIVSLAEEMNKTIVQENEETEKKSITNLSALQIKCENLLRICMRFVNEIKKLSLL